MSGSLWFGDLIRALTELRNTGVELTPATMDSVAHALGFEGCLATAEQVEHSAGGRPPAISSTDSEPATSPPRTRVSESEDSIPFLRPERFTLRQRAKEGPTARASQLAALQLAAPPPTGASRIGASSVEEASAARRGPVPQIDAAVRHTVRSRQVDVLRLIADLSRGRALTRLPRRDVERCACVHVLVDRSVRLRAVFEDHLPVVRRIRAALRGSLRPRFYLVDDISGPEGHVRTGRASDVMLVLSDLGFYADAAVSNEWFRLGRALLERGVIPRAFVPVPRGRWRKEVAHVFGASPWEEGPSLRQTDEARKERVELLLRLVSPAVRIEPDLLRAARDLLGLCGADQGTEVDAWNDPSVYASTGLLVMKAEAAEARRASLSEKEVELVKRLVPRIRRAHARLPRGIWYEEVLALSALPGGGMDVSDEDRTHARAFLEELREVSASLDGERPDHALLARWAGDLAPRLALATEADEPLGDLLREIRSRARGLLPDGTFVVHESDDPASLPPPANVALERFEVVQLGAHLTACAADARARGSWVGTVYGSSSEVALRVRDGARLRTRALLRPGSETAAVSDLRESDGIRPMAVSADGSELELSPFERPDWARNVGRDRFGLWTEIEIERDCVALRWIPPGFFLMGSPEGGRIAEADERPARDVVISHGFWLAAVPCTQAFWDAVTRFDEELPKNPSRFRTPDRPVENVEWIAAVRFCNALSRMQDLDPAYLVEGDDVRWVKTSDGYRLPTEAEWEYACRAGTQTRTYAGDLEILGKNNAPELGELAWYGGNSGVGSEVGHAFDSSKWPEKEHEHVRAATQPVGRKKQNPWGLKDMLGNVYEWCWDYYAAYPLVDGPVWDPTGPVVGSPRVIRGGSWLSRARYVRSAYRGENAPADRDGTLGFRLARGQVEAPGAEPRPPRWARWVPASGHYFTDRYGRVVELDIAGTRVRLRWIPGGSFWMGSPDSEGGRYESEGQRHKVTLPRGYWLGETACTQALWSAVMGSTPSHFQSSDRPVEEVSFEDCQVFLERVNALSPSCRLRLPTEAEWEYACRAGTTESTYAGDLEIVGENNAPVLDEIAWYGGNSGVGFDLGNGFDSSSWPEKQYAQHRSGTHPVGQKDANAWGLRDMLGNVYEWVEDQWHDSYAGAPTDGSAWVDLAVGSPRVFRGGSWSSRARSVRSAYRYRYAPAVRLDYLGFRLARGQEGEEA